jgi:hypothetical protein
MHKMTTSDLIKDGQYLVVGGAASQMFPNATVVAVYGGSIGEGTHEFCMYADGQPAGSMTLRDDNFHYVVLDLLPEDSPYRVKKDPMQMMLSALSSVEDPDNEEEIMGAMFGAMEQAMKGEGL